MNRLTRIAVFTVLALTSPANEEIPLTVGQMVQNSLLVVEGVITKAEELSIEEKKGVGQPLQIRKFRATMKIDKTYKGELTPDEAKSASLTILFRQIDDKRYKGDRIPKIKVGEKYFLFIEVFDTSDAERRSALLITKNNIRESAEVTADATATNALHPKESVPVPK